MQRDPRAWLWDVREAASTIEQFTAGLDAAAYAQTPLVYSAVERKFELIGEALNQLAKTRPDMAARVPYLPQIVAFRNQLIHGYAGRSRYGLGGDCAFAAPAESGRGCAASRTGQGLSWEL
ncbi:MAG: HepT-like ribonuclease domain-containing protein [Polaromonas sp.]